MKKIILFLLVFFVFCRAVEANLSVSPSRIDLLMEAGGYYSGCFELINTYDGIVEINIAAKDWHSYAGNGAHDVNSWLVLEKTKVKLAKDESTEIPYKITVSSSMLGSVSAQVSFTLVPPGNEGVNVRMSFPIYVVIKGTEKIDYSVSKITFHKYNDDIQAAFFVKNDGNIHVRPKGLMKIYGKKNKIVYERNIPESVPVYAGTERGSYRVLIPKGKLQTGLYTVEITVSASGITADKKVKLKINKDGSFQTLK